MNSKLILLVDDNPDDVELGRSIFRKKHPDIELKVARDGVEALEYLENAATKKTSCSTPSVILLDLQMPRMCGLDLLRQIKSTPHLKALRIPVIVLTSSHLDEDILNAYDLGARSYLVKPVDFEEFERIIQQLIIYWIELNKSFSPKAGGAQTKPAPAPEEPDIPEPS